MVIKKVSRGANNMMIAGKIKGFTHKGQVHF